MMRRKLFVLAAALALTLAASPTFDTVVYKGSSSGLVTTRPQAAAGTYNFNLPITAGTNGQVLTSGGGGATAMAWQTSTGQICATWDSTLPVTAQTLEFPIPWASYTVTHMKSKVTGGGSFSVAAKIAGVNITGLSAVSVSGTANTNTNATAANTGVANDQITLVVTSPTGTVNQAYACLVFSHSVN